MKGFLDSKLYGNLLYSVSFEDAGTHVENSELYHIQINIFLMQCQILYRVLSNQTFSTQ